MEVIDLHCDVLWKLSRARGTLRFTDSPDLDVNLERLKEGKIRAQAFAIYIEPEVPSEQKFNEVLQQVDYFYEEVLGNHPEMKHLRSWSDFQKLQEGEIGAFLTLEGVDAIGNDLKKLRILYHLGVLSVGLTWNQANLAADGVGEERGGGLTQLGKEIVEMNNKYRVLTDVSHLSEKGFWDVMELAKYPIATHSNARSLCNHPRNLTDEQAKAMFEKGGMIHLVYHPPFLKEDDSATIDDLIKHIDHFCSLGGVHQLGLGSDFDGITEKVEGLADASMTQNVIEQLLKYFKEEHVRGFAYQNFLDYIAKI